MPRDETQSDLAPRISLHGVGKRFITRDRDVEALRPIDLTVQDHEFIALVGPSGCGKSTILNLIAGLLAPSCGTVSYDG
ncbi:MAG TPA: ATP-binding cassette domain-containing protein, partial [Acetobacteraceae bacterium]